MMFNEYQDRVGELITGIVQQSDSRYTLVQLRERVEALLPRGEQVHGERYDHGQRIKAIITDVSNQAKGPSIIVSRRSPELIRALFELEVPEIADGLVEIQNVAREPGYRSKIAVVSHASGVDPVGACVGPRGSRVRMVVSELRGEKIDIIPFNEEPARFVAKALSPARVREVLVDDEAKQATVIVPDDQLSLAIGKDGLNARLAARLTGWRVDIRSETEFAEEEAEMGYQEEEVSGRCAAILANGKRCPNASLPGSRYCGLPAHQALEGTGHRLPRAAGGRGRRGAGAADEAPPARAERRSDRVRERRPAGRGRSSRTASAGRGRAPVEDGRRSRSPSPRTAGRRGRPPSRGEAAENEEMDAGEAPSRRVRRRRGGGGVVEPGRRCVGCGRSLPKGELLRLVRGGDGRVRPDPDARADGRGAYVCANPDCAARLDRRPPAGAQLSRAGDRDTGDLRLHHRMAKKRVHEIAKERDIPSKDVLAALQKAGLEVTTASSSVDEAEAAKVLGNGASATEAPAKAKKAPQPKARRQGEGRGEPAAEAEAKPAAEARRSRAAKAEAEARREGRGEARPQRPARDSASAHTGGRGQAGRPGGPRSAHSSGGSSAGAAQAAGQRSAAGSVRRDRAGGRRRRRSGGSGGAAVRRSRWRRPRGGGARPTRGGRAGEGGGGGGRAAGAGAS